MTGGGGVKSNIKLLHGNIDMWSFIITPLEYHVEDIELYLPYGKYMVSIGCHFRESRIP